jgi:hypothetical protein
MPSGFGWLTIINTSARASVSACVVAVGVLAPGCLMPVSAGSDLSGFPSDGGSPSSVPADSGVVPDDGGAVGSSAWSGPTEVFCYVDCITGQLQRGDGGDAWDAGGFCGDKTMFPPCTCARQADGGVDFTCYWGCPPSGCFETACGDVQCGSGTTCVERGRCE